MDYDIIDGKAGGKKMEWFKTFIHRVNHRVVS